MNTTNARWQDDALALWGSDWQTPLAQVAGVALRTIQRADKPEGRLAQGIQDWLAETVRLVPAAEQRAYGMAMRAAALGGEAVLMRAIEDCRNRMP